jgi:hypothetical protein
MKPLNLKDGISSNTRKLDTCDNVIRPISVINVVKPTAINEPAPEPEEEQMIMNMIMKKSMWREAGEELVQKQTYTCTYLDTLHSVTRVQGKIVTDIVPTVGYGQINLTIKSLAICPSSNTIYVNETNKPKLL